MDKDPKYLGIPNICFSLTKKRDKREKEFKQQRLKDGFDDSETWSLNYTISRFIYPRLKRYREVGPPTGHPACYTAKKWSNIVDKIVDAFEILSNDDDSFWPNEEQEKIITEGLKLFCKHYRNLWW